MRNPKPKTENAKEHHPRLLSHPFFQYFISVFFISYHLHQFPLLAGDAVIP
jgi:hypothetical protein